MVAALLPAIGTAFAAAGIVRGATRPIGTAIGNTVVDTASDIGDGVKSILGQGEQKFIDTQNGSQQIAQLRSQGYSDQQIGQILALRR